MVGRRKNRPTLTRRRPIVSHGLQSAGGLLSQAAGRSRSRFACRLTVETAQPSSRAMAESEAPSRSRRSSTKHAEPRIAFGRPSLFPRRLAAARPCPFRKCHRSRFKPPFARIDDEVRPLQGMRRRAQSVDLGHSGAQEQRGSGPEKRAKRGEKGRECRGHLPLSLTRPAKKHQCFRSRRDLRKGQDHYSEHTGNFDADLLVSHRVNPARVA